MTIYQCDTCDGATPGGARGSSFLVQPDGRTYHFCSGACLRAFVNRTPLVKAPRNLAIAFVVGAIAEVIIQRLIP